MGINYSESTELAIQGPTQHGTLIQPANWEVSDGQMEALISNFKTLLSSKGGFDTLTHGCLLLIPYIV